MRSTLIHRTLRSSVVPLGTALRDYGLIRAIIERNIGEDAATILAEPITTSDGTHIDWYARGVDYPEALSSLPAGRQAEISQEIAKHRQAIEALAESLSHSRQAHDLKTAELLRDIFGAAGETQVFVLGNQPVVVDWGLMAARGAPLRPGLTAPVSPRALPVTPVVAAAPVSTIVTTTPPPPFEAAPEPLRAIPVERRRGLGWLAWLLWLLFALIVLIIFTLLLRACALAPYLGWMGLGTQCGAQGTGQELAALQAVVSDLENQLRQADCNRPAAPDAVAEAEARTRDTQRGELEISLIWPTTDDLDLHVVFACRGTPTSIGFRQKGQQVCGGMLDQDANVRGPTNSPAEHVVWVEEGNIPSGPMDVVVHYYKDNDEANPTVPYQVIIKRGDRPPQVIEGSVRPSQSVTVTQLQN